MKKDIFILRQLAHRYHALAFSDDNFTKMSRHKNVNDLKAEKPVVLIHEIPWHEMDIDGELTLLCEDPQCQNIERFFRQQLFRAKHFPCDTIYTPFFPVPKIINSAGIGMYTLFEEHDPSARSLIYVDQLKTEDDLAKLHNDTITYDKEASERNLHFVSELIGDIIPVKLTGTSIDYGYALKTMDDLVCLRGLDTFFYDFIENSDFMHKLVGKFTDIFMDRMRQFERLDLFEAQIYEFHCTSALTDDLPKPEGSVKMKNVWGRGLAQIFASVSPQMHKEFDTDYMIKALSPFGLVYYGCCEPLDKKIDIITKIPNLRKLSVTPWADTDGACEQIGKNYVVAAKPNPSLLAYDNVDTDAIRAEAMKIGSAIKRYGCSADIVLKDITTVNGNPKNLIAWHDTFTQTISELFD